MQQELKQQSETGSGPTMLELFERLTIAVENFAATVENLTEKRVKENPPLIPPLKENPKKKSPQSAGARMREEEPEMAEMFDEFWDAYPSACPRKSNRSKCLKKYISFLKNAKDPDELHAKIIAGLDRWKRCLDWTEEGGRFIKAPLVWLNNENWNDTPRAAAQEQDDEDVDETDDAHQFLMRSLARIGRREVAR